MIPVYDENKEIIAQVNYNTNLDYWDGNNQTCGSIGRHMGLTRLKKSGEYVLIHTTPWQGERDTAEVISPLRAVQEIVRSGNENLFDKYPDLKIVMDAKFDQD